MIVPQKFNIIGVGKHLPHKAIQSSEIEHQLNLPEGWIEKYVGVQIRYRADGESNTSMGISALQAALTSAGLGISDIDCLISGAATFDHVIPNRSTLIKAGFEDAKHLNFPCIDINTVCTSFITALEYAALLLATNVHDCIAIVTSEISSKGLNPANVETYSLFGDCATALILTRGGSGGLIKHSLKTYSEGVKSTIIEGGGNAYHPKDHPYDPSLYGFKMDGRKLLKLANLHLEPFIDDFFKPLEINPMQVDWIVPHQASKLGLKMLKSLPNIPESKVINQLNKYGNCIAASVPLALVTTIEQGTIRENDTCFLIGTAAGMSISGLLLKYTTS